MLYFIIGIGCFIGGFGLGYFLGMATIINEYFGSKYEYSEKGNPYN